MDHTKGYGIPKWNRAFCNHVAIYLFLSLSVCTPVARGLEDYSHFQVASRTLAADLVVVRTPPPGRTSFVHVVTPKFFPPPPKSGSNELSPPGIPPSSSILLPPTPSPVTPSPPLQLRPVPPAHLPLEPPPPPPSGNKTWNESEKAGVGIASLAALLQVAVVAFLLIKRHQMLRTVDYDDYNEYDVNSDRNYRHPESV